MSFLDGDRARKKVSELISTTPSAKLAVAFWGDGAIKRLGLDRPRLDLTVICNLESGACNPAEIRRLLELGPSARVLSDPRLHAKVYWTPSGAVVGSSNASTNGLASEAIGEHGWAEGNVFVQKREDVVDIRLWFEERVRHAYQVTIEDIQQVEHLWAQRRAIAPHGRRMTNDLVEAFRSTAGHPAWRNVKLSIWTGELDGDAVSEANSAVITGTASDSWEVYQDWHDELGAGDWLIDFDLSKRKPKHTGFWRVGDPKVETSRVTFVSKQKTLMLPGFPPLSLHDEDRQQLERLVPHLLRDYGEDGGAVIPVADALTLLNW